MLALSSRRLPCRINPLLRIHADMPDRTIAKLLSVAVFVRLVVSVAGCTEKVLCGLHSSSSPKILPVRFSYSEILVYLALSIISSVKSTDTESASTIFSPR